MVYVIQVCRNCSSVLILLASCQLPLLCVQWKTPDDGQGNCPKHVDFYSKNKFEKLVYLVGFIIRVFHDARSPERQILFLFCVFLLFLRWLYNWSLRYGLHLTKYLQKWVELHLYFVKHLHLGLPAIFSPHWCFQQPIRSNI